MASRRCGAVAMTEKSRSPSRDRASVRGIGVAVRVSTSTSRAQLLQLLLLPHAEAMLLVDDHQAEVPELDVLLDELVRADGDVDGAVGQPGDRGGDLLRAAEARELGELHRPRARSGR